LLLIFLYPLFTTSEPLEIIGQGTFFPPGTYVNTYDSIISSPTYMLNLKDADAKRIAQRLPAEDREAMKTWLVTYGIPEDQINVDDTKALLDLWFEYYDPNESLGMIYAKAALL